MNLLKILPIIGIFITVSCGSGATVQSTDMAVQAMERARIAEADIYAPQEYALAEDLFNQMNSAIEQNNIDEANTLANQVVEAANYATDIAKQNKSTRLITQLKQALNMAQDIGIPQDNPTAYGQANQFLIDAENFYQNSDYENATKMAQSGLDILEPLIGGAESLALANLNRARELLDRAYRTTDLTQTEDLLIQASNSIELAATEYQERRYIDSIGSSQNAIDILNELIEKYPSDSSILIDVNTNENLQLQAYDLLRQLEQTLTFIQQEYGTNITTSTTPMVELTPAQPITNSTEGMLTNEMTDTMVDDSMENSYTNMPMDLESTDNTMMDSTQIETMELNTNQTTIVEDKLTSYADPQFISLDFKSQAMTNISNTMRSEAVMTTQTVTIEMIDELYQTSKTYYEEGNYLNSIDASREGLRLAELFLANQSIATHKVIRGDTLWDISTTYYQSPWLWPNIWRANKLIIKDPDLIYPNQKFKIPPASKN